MVAAVQAVVADVVAVAEAVDVERREEGRGEDLSLSTSPSVAPVVLEEDLSHVLPAAAVVAVAEEAALFRGGQGEGESQLPLHHDDQMIHEEENLHHVSQILQEACTCKKYVQDVYFIHRRSKSNTILSYLLGTPWGGALFSGKSSLIGGPLACGGGGGPPPLPP